MKILALEFSANKRSAAIAETQTNGSTRVLSSVQESDFRGVTGLSIIDRAFSEAKLQPSDVRRLAVGLGPGSYTGIRSAIAIAQGWQLARNVELVGISSVVCLAEHTRALCLFGGVTIVIDAQREELYMARYSVEETDVKEVAGLRIVSPANMPPADLIIGPEAAKHFPSGRDIAPSAETLARLAVDATNFTPGELLEPIYLRQTAFVKAPKPRQIE